MATTYFVIACWTLDAAIRRRDSLLLRHRNALNAADIATLTSTAQPLVTLLPSDCRPCPPKPKQAGEVVVQSSTGSLATPSGTPTTAVLDDWTSTGPVMPDAGPFLAITKHGFATIASAEAWLQTADGMLFSDSAGNVFVVAFT
jgi:hypothetical protein